jgi:hypothetical protein
LALVTSSLSTTSTTSFSLNHNPRSSGRGIVIKSGTFVTPHTLRSSSLEDIHVAKQTNSNNIMEAKPELPIPEPLLSTTPGTWAYDTMTRRVDEDILQRTYDENKDILESPAFQQVFLDFNALRSELQNSLTTKMRYLQDVKTDSSLTDEEVQAQTVERAEWNEYLTPFVENGDTWCSTPWLVAEFYVYRRLMEAIGYFDPESAGYKFDPFANQKKAGLVSSISSAEGVMEKIEALPLKGKGDAWKEGVSVAAELALWGNKMDLSLWPAEVGSSDKGEHDNVFAKVLEVAKENLLHDDTAKLQQTAERLRQNGGGNVDIIVDNAGFELVTDLALADHLIADGVASCVTFQLKAHPTFVSDALEKDLRDTVQYYASLDEAKYPHCKRAGDRWQSYLDEGKWVCHEDSFWVQGKEMWNMPLALRTDMHQRCDLAFVKGDANYRRLLGDRKWDYSDSFQSIVGNYFPCPVCALRTLKAEVACGMDKEEVARASDLDDNWLTTGRFGVIHFGTGVEKASTSTS